MDNNGISVCIITRDEEQNLQECMKRLVPYNFEIIVVDTGSTDNSVETAAQYTDKVYHFEWCNDFSKARNFSIEKATGDYILILDTDEFLAPGCNISEVYKLVKQHPNEVGRMKRVNLYVRGGKEFKFTEYINRFFLKSLYHYEGRIHEQICADNGEGYDTYNLPFTVVHEGYDGSEESLSKKADRNMILLKEELIENGDDPYILYQLGKSCYIKKDFNGACLWFSKGLEFDLNTKLEYVIDMVESYGYALVNAGRSKEALTFEGIYSEFCKSTDFVFLMGIIYMNNEMFDEAAAEFLKASGMDNGKIEGVNSYLSFYNLGVMNECLGHVDKALEFYGKCGNYEPAKERINAVKLT